MKHAIITSVIVASVSGHPFSEETRNRAIVTVAVLLAVTSVKDLYNRRQAMRQLAREVAGTT